MPSSMNTSPNTRRRSQNSMRSSTSIVPTGPAQSTLAHDLKIRFLEHAIKYDAHLKAVFQAM